jgi:putative ABC transport system permease protein
VEWKTRIRAAFGTAAHVPEEDVLDELAQHASASYEAARAEGLSHEEADRVVSDHLDRWRRDAAALHHKSDRPTVVEAPPADAPSHTAGLAHDVRYAARLLRRQSRYAAVTAVTMALGIAATTVLFSVTWGVLMKPLPWRDAGRLVVLKETRGGNQPRFGAFSNAAYLAWRDRKTTIEELAAWSQRTVTLAGAGEPERIRITAASASLFDVLDARPLLGSVFRQEDELSTQGAIVLSERLWRRRFGADPGALGRLVQLDGQAFTIIGVLPDAVAYPDRQALAWVPLRVMPATGNSLSVFNALARLSPGATPAQAAAEGTARGRFAPDSGMTAMAIFGGRGPIEVSAVPLREALTSDVRRPLVVMLIAVGLLLVTATANVASLQLARATTRRRELAIRAALGAGRLRVMRQLLVESLLLGTAGGGAGLLLALLLHRLLPFLLPSDFPRLDDLGLDVVVILFSCLLSLVTSIIFGVLPAVRLRGLNLVESLVEDGTSAVGGGSRSRTARARLVIMAAQVAIACVLLVGASLLGRSFLALLTADRGYDPAGVLTARVWLPSTMYTPERRYLLVRQILARLDGTAGVSDAAFTTEQPLTPGGSTSAFTLRSPRAEGGTLSVQASPRIVSPRGFAALGMRVVAGRSFADSDTETSEPVVIVNRAFARRYLGDAPLGAKLPMGVGYRTEGVEATLVGIVDDVRYLTAADASQPEIYYSYRQFENRLPAPVVTLLVRTHGDPAALAAAMRTAIREADDRLVPDAVVTLEDRMLTSLARPRLYAILLGSFGILALGVATVGLFAVLSYTVAQRSRELAVRTALGARPIDIIRLVLHQGLAVTAAGLVVGLLASVALARSIAALLYGVTPHDGVTYALVPIVVLVMASAACFAPARRASRLDPLQTLRR